MRTISSIKNIIISVALGALVIIVNFATQKFFINYLGVELLGLNGLFTNIITMLSVAELGFESAVVYHMYKPLHENKKSEISSLMHFYKISYRVIAVIIATSALILIPFIPTIAGNPDIPSNIYNLRSVCNKFCCFIPTILQTFNFICRPEKLHS